MREKSAVKILQKNFGINSIHVLDPTLLLDKNNYLELIKNYKSNISVNENYIFSYLISPPDYILKIVNKFALKLNYKVHFFLLNNDTSIQNFLYQISHCKAVITNSFHGTIFSIIFNKPFIIIRDIKTPRFASLGEIFEIKSRVISKYDITKLHLLNEPLKINITLFNYLKEKSLNFLKNISKY